MVACEVGDYFVRGVRLIDFLSFSATLIMGFLGDFLIALLMGEIPDSYLALGFFNSNSSSSLSSSRIFLEVSYCGV